MTERGSFWLGVLALQVGCSAPLKMARVELCPTKDGPVQLNPAWDQLDRNGLPLNPRWRAQAPDAQPCLVDPGRADTCGGFPTDDPTGVPLGRPQCTDFAVADEPDGFHHTTCNFGHIPNTTLYGGHINWMPATYSGLIFYRLHAFPDDDYNFELLPVSITPEGRWRADRPGLTVGNQLRQKYLGSDKAARQAAARQGLDYTVHVESRGKETLDHFTQDWWVRFREASPKAARKAVPGLRGVATGLFGLDAEHKTIAELHPAYALAIRTSECTEAPLTEGPHKGSYVDEWAIMFRNSGNEGWCSSWDRLHWLRPPDRTFTLSLPGDFQGGARDVRVVQLDLRANEEGTQISPPTVDAGGFGLTMGWSTDGPLRIHGVVRLAWTPQPGTVRNCLTLGRLTGASESRVRPGSLPAAPATRSADPRLKNEENEEADASAFLARVMAAMPQPYAKEVRALTKDVDDLEDRKAVTVDASLQPSTPGAAGYCPGNVADCEGLKSSLRDEFDGSRVAEDSGEQWHKALCAGGAQILREGKIPVGDRACLRLALANEGCQDLPSENGLPACSRGR